MIYQLYYSDKTNSLFKKNKILLNTSNIELNNNTNDIIYINQNETINNDSCIININNHIYSLDFNKNILSNNFLKYYYVSLNSKYFTIKKHRKNIIYGYHLSDTHNIKNITVSFQNKYITFNKSQKITTITKNPIVLSNTYMFISDKHYLTLFTIDNKLHASLSLYNYDFDYINFYGNILLEQLSDITLFLEPDDTVFLHKYSDINYDDVCSKTKLHIHGSL